MIHFISDLHLSPQAPGVTRIFLAYLAGFARSSRHLYILGDLFEAWPGDDCIDDPEDAYPGEIVTALRELSTAGTRLSIMRGNRDFLLGEDFATRCAAEILPDAHRISLDDTRFVLAHGDALCTDDSDYQRFRHQIRTTEWQASFLAKPLTERKAIAADLRRRSEEAKREKMQRDKYVMDLNPAVIEDFLRENGHATFIHGHTHRPARHFHHLDGLCIERWVLSDWHEERGEVLCWNGHQLDRIML